MCGSVLFTRQDRYISFTDLLYSKWTKEWHSYWYHRWLMEMKHQHGLTYLCRSVRRRIGRGLSQLFVSSLRGAIRTNKLLHLLNLFLCKIHANRMKPADKSHHGVKSIEMLTQLLASCHTQYSLLEATGLIYALKLNQLKPIASNPLTWIIWAALQHMMLHHLSLMKIKQLWNGVQLAWSLLKLLNYLHLSVYIVVSE